MHAGDGDRARRIPRLAPDCDPTRLELTPAEGFLLSRIDGHTPLGLLPQLTGLPPAEIDRCLERWVEKGVVLLESGGSLSRPQPPRAQAGPKDAAPAVAAPAAAEIDPGLEIPPDAQRAILDFEARLGRPYPEILGVPFDADVRAVKRAYFELSKQFHPDRYFRKDIGPFQPRVERVFRKIVEAYELLSDPNTREELLREARERAEEAAAAPAPEASGATGTAPGPSSRRRRRDRPLNPFSPMGRLLAQRKAKAKTFFEAGMAAFGEERWLEAAASVRLAIAYDPGNDLYKERFGEVQTHANEVRFAQVLKEAENAMAFKDRGDALRLYEEALHYRPFDAGVNHTASRLAWLVADDLRNAKEYAARACEAEPENAGYRRTLGQIYKAAGLKANARRELQQALRLDPKDAEARAELKSL